MNLKNVKQDVDTRYVPVIGYPMKHSMSPTLYNTMFSLYGINAIMWPLEIEKGRLGEFMQAYKVFGVKRFALTMPHKADIIPFLDDVDECSRLFESVNIVKVENGKTIGCGFDGKGCVGALKAAGVELNGKNVLILGAGGICGAIGYELAANGVQSITILNRTLSKAQRVAEILNANTNATVTAGESTEDNLDSAAVKADVLINIRPLGMQGFGAETQYVGYVSKLPEHAGVLDAVVNPPVTPILAEAERHGLKTVKGMDMMMAQTTEIMKFWYGIEPGDAEKEVCKKAMCERLNINI